MKYFGTDGIRGIPNKKLTIELVTKLGTALRTLGVKDVVIATDTRVSKDMLAYAVASGAMSKGLTVHFAGVIPTPALIYYSYIKKMTGVMITASHNPYTDNGIKVLNKGIKLSEKEEIQLENEIDNPSEYDGEIGSLLEENCAKSIYMEFIDKKLKASSLNICIDCANGATSTTAPEIFSKITKKLTVIANHPDGYNINKGVGSTHLELLKDSVLKNHCDIGFAFDGDGDRVLCVDQDGKTIDGDMLIYILARYLKSVGKLHQDTVVLSMMSNKGLIADLEKKGIKTIETPVGDKYIVKALLENNLSVGGENSGHIILPDELHTGDGVFVAMMIVKLLEETNTKIYDWLKDVKMYADTMVNIKVENKNKVLENKALFNRIEEIKKELNNDCKIIVRPSGTEELIRVTVMAQTEALVKKYIDELVSMVNEMEN